MAESALIPTEEKPKELRAKIVWIDERQIVDMLNWQRGPDFLALPVIQSLPEGFTVRAVHHSFRHMAWAVVVEHPSFEPVNPACELPEWNPSMTARVEVVQVRRIEPRLLPAKQPCQCEIYQSCNQCRSD